MRLDQKNIPPFVIVSILFGLKTYIVYRFVFEITVETIPQEIILGINSLISSFIIFSITVLFQKRSSQLSYLKYTSLVVTAILYFNLVFYRSFTDFLTFPQLFQLNNMGDLGSSILSLIHPLDIFIFLDVYIIWYLCKNTFSKINNKGSKKYKAFVLTSALFLLSFNFLLAEIERPQLLKRGFDREYLVKNIGLINYHIYDLLTHSRLTAKKVLADGNELSEITSFIQENVRSEHESSLFNIAEGKNIIFISAESLQSFVIDQYVKGQEITPFLNSLKNNKDTYYFENFYHQTEQGKTSDSEFITENSLYPTSRGAVFFTHSENKYNSLANMLKEKDYFSAVLHPNDGSFWNRVQMYESFKIDKFLDREFYDINEENSVGWGLKDKEFFSQSIEHLSSFKQPFYAKMITLTNHFPFELKEEDQSIEAYDSNSTVFNNYFPTVRYMDEAIEQFFKDLKRKGLYEDSIIIIMGDHDGISAKHHKAISQYLNKDELSSFDLIQWQRVPLFIHIPNHGQGEVMSTVSGQVDLKPTILHMAGIHTDHDIYFGNDLFHTGRKGFIAFRNGNFVSEKYVFTNEICYDRKTGKELSLDREVHLSMIEECELIRDQVVQELLFSDEIIYGDLFRYVQFHE